MCEIALSQIFFEHFLHVVSILGPYKCHWLIMKTLFKGSAFLSDMIIVLDLRFSITFNYVHQIVL